MTTSHRPTWMAALGGGDGVRDGSSGDHHTSNK